MAVQQDVDPQWPSAKSTWLKVCINAFKNFRFIAPRNKPKNE